MKLKLRQEQIVREKELFEIEERIAEIVEKREIIFEDEIEIDYEMIKNEYGHRFVEASIKVGEEIKRCLISKDYIDALIEPTAESSLILKKAYQNLKDYLKKRGIDVHSSMLARRTLEAYISALIMILAEFPKDKLNEEVLREMGIYDEEMGKLYEEAAILAFGDIDKKSSFNLNSYVEKIEGGETKTVTANRIVVNLHTCNKGSHYVLKPEIQRIQETYNVRVTEFNKEYREIEDKIVEYIQKNAKNPLVRDNARDLVRLYLNLRYGYSKNKALPIMP